MDLKKSLYRGGKGASNIALQRSTLAAIQTILTQDPSNNINDSASKSWFTAAETCVTY